ncbi:MAG: SH3 domain-containing protein, partial [Ruminococcaceae bacterium]|nr:SH3 domain-containing protein [Oscillospiraceae bacterium]
IMDLLDRNGSDAVAGLCAGGEIDCVWLAAIDEQRLNAVLREDFKFYLFRDRELLEMQPVAQITTPKDELRQHYRLEIQQDDQILIFPSGLIPAALHNEAEAVLNGMQQLPDRLSSLIMQMRSRGVTAPANGWLALQALYVTPKFILTDRSGFSVGSGRKKQSDTANDPGYSLPLIDAEKFVANSRAEASALNSSRLIKIVAAAALAVIILAVVFLLLRPGDDSAATTGSSLPSESTTSTTVPTTRRTTATTTIATTKPRLPSYVIARRLNLRSEASTTGKLIRTLTVGDVLYVLEKTNEDWVKVETESGEEGFVYAAYISDDKPSS